MPCIASVAGASGFHGQDARATEAIADLLLVHDRPIVRPVDDSVARVGPDGLQVLRRARGFAPLPIKLNFAAPPILAVGGHLKNTVALAVGGAPALSPAFIAEKNAVDNGTRARAGLPCVLSQHIGDLESPLSLDVFRRAIDDLLEFFAVEPQAVACDLHPDYASTRYAEELARRFKFPSCACSIITPTSPPAWRNMVWRGPCWGFPGTARATAPTARSGAARPSCATARTIIAWPICGHSPCPAAIGRRGSRGGRRWGCSTKYWVPRPSTRYRSG